MLNKFKGEISLTIAEKIQSGSTTTQESYPPSNGDRSNGVRNILRKIGKKLGVEERGIERVPSDQRSTGGMYQIALLWMSANLTAPNLAIGASAIPTFKLGFADAALVIILVNIIAVMPVCLFSVLGARFGLRQMVLSRFYFGYHLVKFAAVLNIVTMVGWTVLNVLIAGQIIHAVNPDIPSWLSILITGISTLVIALVGHQLLQAFERWVLIPCFVVFLIFLGTLVHAGGFDNLLPLATGQDEANAILSFATASYGATSGWCLVAADYLVYQPSDRPTITIYLYTFFGLVTPVLFTQLLGLVIATTTVHDPVFRAAYDEGGIGAVLAQLIVPPLGSFGKFCLIILALTIVAVNSPPIYSVSFSLQLLGERLRRIPRSVCTLITSIAYIVIAIPAYDYFGVWLGNFLVLFGYWVGVYQAIAFVEHYIFREGGSKYNVEDYNTSERLPKGYAALAGIIGGITGSILGMATVFWVGPIATALGGADMGLVMAFVLGGGVYLMARWWERKTWGDETRSVP